MSKYIITTDNTCDFPDSYIEENQLVLISLNYTINGITYDHENSLTPPEFYNKVRAGAMPTTSQINPKTAEIEFAKVLEKGYDVLHIAFSSGLSGSYNSVMIAAETLREIYPERKITVIDSLCASLGEGLLVHKVLELRKKGKSMEEAARWAEEYKLNICHNFTVDDLNHLHRGGRVSKTAAVLGTMINIKPILHVNNEGRLINIGKVRGRKKSLMTLVDNMEKQMGEFQNQNDIVFISHGDCLDDAELVAELVRERFGIDSFLINYVGPTIGAHSGPGTVALFFMGEER